MNGRKPKPSDQRKIAGGPNKHRINMREPNPPAMSPAGAELIPSEVGESPVARGEWLRLAPMLRACRQVSEADRAALVAVCVEWGRYLEANAQVGSKLVIKTKTGYMMPNPYLSLAGKALSQCIRLWAELGLTPSSRSRVVLPPDASDPFGEFDKMPPPVSSKTLEEINAEFQ